jgi:pimeloyl-ACP methyl ester carboxylesterase
MRRALAICLSVLTALLLFPATAGATTSWADLRHQFDYRRTQISVTEISAREVSGAVVHDITYWAPGQDPVSAYLVTPTRPASQARDAPRRPEVQAPRKHAAALFLHWLAETPDANRSEFLDEAIGLAAGRDHVVSLLPQLVFPFDYGPVGDVRDRDSIVKQVVQLRRGLDLLDGRPDVDAGRVAVVGHDYGGMYAALIAAIDRNRVTSAVIMAADATWANWFVLYFLDLQPDQVQPYTNLLTSLDPVVFLPHAPADVLLQYASDDFFIPLSVAQQMRSAAPSTATFVTYAVDHSLHTPPARHQRDRFLTRTLR